MAAACIDVVPNRGFAKHTFPRNVELLTKSNIDVGASSLRMIVVLYRITLIRAEKPVQYPSGSLYSAGKPSAFGDRYRADIPRSLRISARMGSPFQNTSA